ncbi:MAG TPA: hypothetical protein VKG22_05055 [Stellaceae bacterium]|nr:hypothetical protein [Stellaceae bacterium]
MGSVSTGADAAVSDNGRTSSSLAMTGINADTTCRIYGFGLWCSADNLVRVVCR